VEEKNKTTFFWEAFWFPLVALFLNLRPTKEYRFFPKSAHRILIFPVQALFIGGSMGFNRCPHRLPGLKVGKISAILPLAQAQADALRHAFASRPVVAQVGSSAPRPTSVLFLQAIHAQKQKRMKGGFCERPAKPVQLRGSSIGTIARENSVNKRNKALQVLRKRVSLVDPARRLPSTRDRFLSGRWRCLPLASAVL